MPQEEFIERTMRQGAYQVFSAGRDFSDTLQDFFRGILNDNPADRWGLDQLSQFIGGKRFNMIAPTPPKEAARPIVFDGENIFSRRVIVNAMRKNWREATKDIRALSLARWCETSLHRPELAERLDRAIRSGGGGAMSNDKQLTDMMTRVFAILDPAGPLRTKTLSLRPDAIPMMIASVIEDKGPELGQLLHMIQTNICSFWMEQHDSNKSPDMSQFIWRLQRVKPYIESRALGFGVERALYELNPSMCCQSPLLKPYHVTSVVEALSTLDILAKSAAQDTSLIDRHIAAFLAAKIDLNREIRLDDVTRIPELSENQELIMLRLIARAQQKHARLKLIGLCAWSGMRIEKMFDTIHNRVIRKRQKLLLKKLVSTGSVSEVLSSIVNRDVVIRDTDGFVQALALHDINNKRIEFLQNPLVLEYKARKSGGRMAVTISYTALTIMGYWVMTSLIF
jgi:hypothetical protein